MLLAALALAASFDLPADLAAVAALPGEPHTVSAAAIASDDGKLLTLEDRTPLDPSSRRRVVVVAAIGSSDEVGNAVVQAVRWFKTSAPAALRRGWALSAAPVATVDQPSRLARWVAFQAPDVIVELGSGGVATWSESTMKEVSAGLGSVPVATLAVDRNVSMALADLLNKLPAERSPLHTALVARTSRDPLAIARLLAEKYPQQPAISYIPAVAWMNMLRLTGITKEPRWRDKVVEQTKPWVSGEKPLFGNQTPLTAISGAMIFADMKDGARSAALMKQPAELAAALKDDGTYANGRGWTDDMFMATAVLARTGQLDLAARKLVEYAARLQRPDGVFIHGTDGPWAWGRGNGFAAFGAMEALTAMRADSPQRPAILTMFRRHMAALVKAQAPDGMWNEIIDEPGSYRELTATAMIFSAMSRGIRLGWLDRSYAPVAERAWRAIAAHVGDDGALVDVCESTGAGPTKGYYLNRKAINGPDDRGGAMVLMAAIEKRIS
jgi:unsaturated rhamnogalacturonyl hydrolase